MIYLLKECTMGMAILYVVGYIVWGIGILTIIYCLFINTDVIGFKWNKRFQKIKILKVVEEGRTQYEIWKRWGFIFLIGHGGDYALAWKYDTYEEAQEAVKKILKNTPYRIEEEIMSI